VDAIAADVARTLEQRHPPKPVKARALCDVHSTRGFLAVMVVHERLESGASLVTAHGTARTGDVAKVCLRNRQLQSTGRLSSATGGDWRLLQSWENNCLWTHVRGLIWFAVFVVVQAHDRTVCAKKLEEMCPMSVRVGVVGIALRLEDAKAHADYARADDAKGETRRGRPQQLLPVVEWVVCHVLV
jgi:hypothetical protein